MALPKTVAGTIGRFEAPEVTLESFSGLDGERVLDVDGEQVELDGTSATVTGRASTVIEDTEPRVRVHGTDIELDREQVDKRVGTEFAVRGQTAAADTTVEEGGGTFPFTLLSAVGKVKCERLNFDTESIRAAWKEDGSLSDTWMAGSKDDGSGTVMAYGEASEDAKSDIGLGFERSWQGYMLQGVVFASGYVAVYEDLGNTAFLRFVTETLVPHGYVPDDDADDEQQTLGEAPVP